MYVAQAGPVAFKFYLICMSILLAYMPMYDLHDWCPWKPAEGIRCPGTGVTDRCKPQGVC